MQLCASKIEHDPLKGKIYLEMIQFLIEHGANPLKTALDKKNCFELAIGNPNYREIKEILGSCKQIYFYNNDKESTATKGFFSSWFNRKNIDKRKEINTEFNDEMDKNGKNKNFSRDKIIVEPKKTKCGCCSILFCRY